MKDRNTMRVVMLLSGGTGQRLASNVPKQYISVDGEMIVTKTLAAVLGSEMVDSVQIVAAQEWRDEILKEAQKCIPSDVFHKIKGFSLPGENRQLSIYHALMDILDYAVEDSPVMVHDAVRPIIHHKQIADCFSAIDGHDGVMPVLPMKDTVYVSKDGRSVSSLIDRATVFAGQAPEVYRLGKYKEACEALLPEKILSINGATEPAILFGMDIAMIEGDERNFKITTMEDLHRYMELVTNEQKDDPTWPS